MATQKEVFAVPNKCCLKSIMNSCNPVTSATSFQNYQFSGPVCPAFLGLGKLSEKCLKKVLRQKCFSKIPRSQTSENCWVPRREELGVWRRTSRLRLAMLFVGGFIGRFQPRQQDLHGLTNWSMLRVSIISCQIKRTNIYPGDCPTSWIMNHELQSMKDSERMC